MDSFELRNRESIQKMSQDSEIKELSNNWLNASLRHEYLHHFTWLGMPIIQLPQDIIAMQEIIWKVKPDLIIEMGVARGGSVIFYASMLELLGNDGKVVGVDIDIRENNRTKIENHPMYKRITLIEGSSIDEKTVQEVHKIAEGKEKVMVVLDSNHTYDHAYKELSLYWSLVTLNSYLVVFDTVIEDILDEFCEDRPWGKGNNPKTAVHQFLREHDEFVIDKEIENKLLITVAPGGYLKCVR